MQSPGIHSISRNVAMFALASALALPVWAQDTTSTAASQSASPATAQQQPSNTADQPLSPPKEGFWGRINPFASKKWVKKQTDPINDRLSELDEVNARNARDIKDVDAKTFDLSVRNPNGGEGEALRSPEEILGEIAVLDSESAKVLAKIRALL